MDPKNDPENPVFATGTDDGGANFAFLKKRFGMYQCAELAKALQNHPTSTGDLVEGLLPPASVNILAGDSGVGKSPLGYQLALAVAAGSPFLGMPTRQSRVLLVDYENSLTRAHAILDRQRRHLGLTKWPHLLVLWSLHLDPLQEHVEEVIRHMDPGLVIIDSLRCFNPKMESDHRTAVEQIKRLRTISARHGLSFLLIHHLRKNRLSGLGTLEDSEALDWLYRVAGVRALVNQTDLRLAVAKRQKSADGGLVLRGQLRTRGEVGPLFLRRRWDDEGEPLGFARLSPSPDLLEDQQQDLFRQLPKEFQFGEAQSLCGGHPETTNRLVHRLLDLGLARKVARGQYQKEVLHTEVA